MAVGAAAAEIELMFNNALFDENTECVCVSPGYYRNVRLLLLCAYLWRNKQRRRNGVIFNTNRAYFSDRLQYHQHFSSSLSLFTYQTIFWWQAAIHIPLSPSHSLAGVCGRGLF